MSIVKLDEYRAARASAEREDDVPDFVTPRVFDDLPTEEEADLALQLADAQARITELELVLVETLKRNALNWARAQEAEAKLADLTG
ncbi:MAG: hypothetical protein AAGF44_04090 [Pseudomonadota bacterium]